MRDPQGHVIWHIFMTLGLLNCLVYAAMLRADNFRQRPRFMGANAGCCGCGALYFAILPGLVFFVEEDVHEWGRTADGTAYAAPRTRRRQERTAARATRCSERGVATTPQALRPPSYDEVPQGPRRLGEAADGAAAADPTQLEEAAGAASGGEDEDEANSHLGDDPMLLGWFWLSRTVYGSGASAHEGASMIAQGACACEAPPQPPISAAERTAGATSGGAMLRHESSGFI